MPKPTPEEVALRAENREAYLKLSPEQQELVAKIEQFNRSSSGIISDRLGGKEGDHLRKDIIAKVSNLPAEEALAQSVSYEQMKAQANRVVVAGEQSRLTSIMNQTLNQVGLDKETLAIADTRGRTFSGVAVEYAINRESIGREAKDTIHVDSDALAKVLERMGSKEVVTNVKKVAPISDEKVAQLQAAAAEKGA